MKEYTEEMRLNDEYPTVGQKVILNILDEAMDSENERQHNGSELIVVKNRTVEPLGLPIFYCVEHGFEISINNAHFKALDSVVYNAALQHPPAPSLEVESDSNNDEWPKVGDEVVLHFTTAPLLLDECNLDEHCIVDTWRSGDVLEVIAIVETFDEKRLPVVQNKRTREVSSIITECIKQPKSKEDLLIEELQAKLIKNNAVDNWILAANIISGDIEGLIYKGDSDD